MSPTFLIQTAISLLAILALVGLAAWARIARNPPELDQETVKALLEHEFPDHRIEAVWIAADARSAVARSGADALILYRAGDGHVARSLPWSRLAAARPDRGAMLLKLGDVTAPRARFAVTEGAPWPPPMEGR